MASTPGSTRRIRSTVRTRTASVSVSVSGSASRSSSTCSQVRSPHHARAVELPVPAGMMPSTWPGLAESTRALVTSLAVPSPPTASTRSAAAAAARVAAWPGAPVRATWTLDPGVSSGDRRTADATRPISASSTAPAAGLAITTQSVRSLVSVAVPAAIRAGGADVVVMVRTFRWRRPGRARRARRARRPAGRPARRSARRSTRGVDGAGAGGRAGWATTSCLCP